MITYKEKDKLATYILSIGLIDFNIKYNEVFPDEEISKNEFFLILRQFVDMGLLSRSKEMIEDMMKDKFDDIDKYLPYEVCTVELVRAIYKYRDVESLVKRNVFVKFSSDGFPDVK